MLSRTSLDLNQEQRVFLRKKMVKTCRNLKSSYLCIVKRKDDT